jgi:nucleoside-diphosphate-sugar epimerase
MRVLVTGHRGYLGSVLTKKLDDWVGYDVKDGKDILDSNKLRWSLKGIDAVVHLAGLVGEHICHQNIKAYKVNGVGTLNLVDLARRMDIQRLITVSTCSIYGVGGDYAQSKVLAEVATRAYGYLVLRLGSLYGGSSPTDSLPEVMKKQALERKKIDVFNSEEWRPLTHVEDAVKAILLFLDKNAISQKFDVVGENITKGKLAYLIAKKFGAKVEIGRGDTNSYKVEDDLRSFGFKYDWNIGRWLDDSFVETS